MRILVSNDDGVLAPGIATLASTLASLASIEVMAPDRNRSGASNSLTLNRPLAIRKLPNGYYSVDGTPTDCVHLGLTGFLELPIDMVVSGINDGANLGDDILYSGTVAAAMEGRYLGLPALAISLAGEACQHYATAALVAKQLVSELSRQTLPAQTILNVNVPDVAPENLKGMRVTRLGSRHAAEPTLKQQDPRGRTVYWVGPPGAASDAGDGTDFDAINKGYVSITPIHLDLTHYKLMDDLSNCLDRIRLLD